MQPLRSAPGKARAEVKAFRDAASGNVREKLFELIRTRSFGRGRIVLASGKVSDFYFDMKPTMLHRAGAAWLAELMVRALDDVDVDYVGGPEIGAVPLVGAICQLCHVEDRPINGFFVRKAVKDHGAKKTIEGLCGSESLRGKNVAIVEDVTTTGDSAMRAVDVVRAEGANVVLVLSIVDRQEGATENFNKAGLAFRSLFGADEFLAHGS
jgi:orotate phosphoribosyltransferase